MVFGSRSAVTVTRDTLDEHRETRRLGEEAGAGQPVEVRYLNIPFERMYTTDVVESVVRPMALKKHESYAESEAPPGTLDLPTYFISHAWGSVFVDLVDAVAAELNGAAAATTFVWLDIFAINQDNTGGVFSAMDELNEGQTLADVINLSRATKVVLDKDRVSPLRRLWCLYEIGSTPMDKLELVTHQFSERDIAQHLRSIDASTALCFSSDDKRMIQSMIVKQFGTMERFTEELKLRFLLRPMSYEADLCVLRERGAAEVLRLDAAHDHVTASAGQLACVVGTAGQGKSTLAAAMAGDPRGP